MAKLPIQPTSILEKCYLDTHKLTAEETVALAELINSVADTNGVFIYAEDEDTEFAYIQVGASYVAGSDKWTITIDAYDHTGEIENTYSVCSIDLGGTAAGQWFNYMTHVEVSENEVELVINAEQASVSRVWDESDITLEKNTVLKNLIYIKGDDPEPEPETKTECQLKNGYKLLYGSAATIRTLKATKTTPASTDADVTYKKQGGTVDPKDFKVIYEKDGALYGIDKTTGAEIEFSIYSGNDCVLGEDIVNK